MSKQRDAKLAKLVKKLGNAPQKPAKILRRQYDNTLPPEQEKSDEREAFFSEMKKREF